MRAWIDPWLDLLQGGRCVGCARPGRSLCDACRAELPDVAREVAPDPRPEGLARCLSAGEYAGLLRALVLAHKEHAVHDVCRPLADCLAVAVRPALSRGVATVLVPVPSSPGVVRRRGHDPLARVARRAAAVLATRETPVEVLSLLAQRGTVLDQSGLDTGARRANRAGTMRVRPRARRRLATLTRVGGPVVVVVVDDVLTTGATVREAQRALEVAGVGVRAVATVAATRRRHPVSRHSLPVVGPHH